ncbi:hypothetical protein B7P43_G09685 [Cryptotermes secundus]|uniref:Uncharacterized protein n=1 Tax=Cryptotermes secundus TaxID=105785 RepID=A0A2J7Q783_9NEOP|nr:hypothetical protein B7P43_G09685 [Cryptotermes secundus]
MLRKPVLDDVSCVNMGIVFLVNCITFVKQSLHHGMDLVAQNGHIVIGSYVTLQGNDGSDRIPRYGCPYHDD